MARPSSEGGSRLTWNASVSIVQALVTGATYFVLYRSLLTTVGIEKLGLWSILTAVASIGRIGELGLTGSVVVFVARQRAKRDPIGAARAAETAFLSMALVSGAAQLLAFIPLTWLLSTLLPRSTLPEAVALLPFAMCSFWLISLGSLILAAIEGCQRADISSAFKMVIAVLYLPAALLFVESAGLVGLAYAQIGISLLLIFVAWIVLRLEIGHLPALPHRIDRGLLREMTAYGSATQVTTLIQLLCDPITKGLLGKFGDLSTVGYYELASRMFFQVRTALATPSQAIVPVVAALKETDPAGITRLYEDSYRVQLYLSLPLYAATIAFLPIISILWIGHYQQSFILFATILALASFLGGLINPAYFCNLGAARLRWNIVSQVAIGLMNAVLGFLAGASFGGEGVIYAWAVAFVLGNWLLLLAFHSEHLLPLGRAFPIESVPLALRCGSGAGLAWTIYNGASGAIPLLALLILTISAFGVLVVPAFWCHPLRVKLLAMLKSARSQRQPV